MSIATRQKLTERVPAPIGYQAEQLIALIRTRHADARVRGPTYWSEENLWIIDAFFDHGEDFELQARLSERETDILLSEGIWLCVVLMPSAAYGTLTMEAPY